MSDAADAQGPMPAAAPRGDGAADDRGLMVRVQAGDEAALNALMERWERPVKALIGRIVLNAREAEELAQEAFVRLWQQRAKFRPDAAFRPWLFAIAVNLARNRLRWWRRRPDVALDAWSESDLPPAAAGFRDSPAGGTAGSGAETLERAERAAAVRDAIAALPLEWREVVVLFEYEQLSHAEIAAALDLTAKAVEARLYRARQKLRTQLASWL